MYTRLKLKIFLKQKAKEGQTMGLEVYKTNAEKKSGTHVRPSVLEARKFAKEQKWDICNV